MKKINSQYKAKFTVSVKYKIYSKTMKKNSWYKRQRIDNCYFAPRSPESR